MKRLSRNISWLLGADIARRVLGFVSVAYLARTLGTDGFGVVTLGWTVLAYGLVVGAGGLPTLGIRQTAIDPENPPASGIFGARFVLSSVVFVIVTIVAALFVHDRMTAWVMVVMSMALFAQALWPDWYFQGIENIGPLATARVLSSAVYLAVVIAFVHSPADILWVAAGAVAGDILAADLLVRLMRNRGVAFRMDVRFSTVRALLLRSFPLAVGGIVANLCINYPMLALGILRDNSDVGIYGASSKLVFFLLVGDRIVATLLLPASSRLHARAPEALKAALEYAQRWVLLLGLPVAAGGMLLARPLVTVVFGPAFADAAPVFGVFVWYSLFTMIHTVYTSGLLASGASASYGKVMGVTAGLYAVGVTAGAHYFGAIGAAFGAMAAEGGSVLLMRRAFNSVVRLAPPERLVGMALATLVMAGAVALVAEGRLIVPVLVGIATYVVFLAVTGALSMNDIRELRGRI